MPPTSTTTNCKGCHAPVQRIRTRIHRPVDLEAQPHLDGYFEITIDNFALRLTGRSLEKAKRSGTPLYREHVCGRGEGA